MSAEQKFKCEICGKSYKATTNSYLKSHNITLKEYKEIYPDSIMGNFDRFKDRIKSKAIIDEGYVLKRYWASELKNISHDKVFEDIVHTSMKVEE